DRPSAASGAPRGTSPIARGPEESQSWFLLRCPRPAQEWLADSQKRSLGDAVAELEARRREDQDRGAVLEPAQLLALAVPRLARNVVRPAVTQVERAGERVDANACHEDRRHGDERDALVRFREHELQHRALVLAEESLDAPERDGIHVPGVAGDVNHALQGSVAWGMESVVEARLDPQRDVETIAILIDEA